jgi:hypothetical protein
MSTELSQQNNEIAVPGIYFPTCGEANTRRTLEIAAQRAGELGLEKILVATTSGKTALLALDFVAGERLVAVTHSTGFSRPDYQELSEPVRRQLQDAGVHVLTCQHALGGVNRAVRKKLSTYQLDEIIAFTLRLFGQGTKVAVEIALMAADAGLVSTAEPCLSIGGSSRGADTALILKPAHAQDFFELRILEILAKPHHPD